MKAYGVYFEDRLCHIETTEMYAIYVHREDAEDHADALSDGVFLKYVVTEVNIEEKEVK